MRILLAFSLLLLGAPAMADDALLARLAGDWVGNGTFRMSADAEAERIYCKIANTLIDDGNTLQQKGRCAVASNTGAIDGTIEALGGNRYGGSLDSLASVGPATISGQGGSDRLVIEADYIDSRGNEPVKSRTTLTVRADGYSLVSEQTDPADGSSYISTEIVFTAQ
jgi:hypothetical protein